MKTCVTNGLLSRVGAALPMKAKPDIKKRYSSCYQDE